MSAVAPPASLPSASAAPTTAPPPAPAEEAVAVEAAATEAPVYGAPLVLPMAEERTAAEPPLTAREVLHYVVMVVLGLLITAVTVWFYWLVQ